MARKITLLKVALFRTFLELRGTVFLFSTFEYAKIDYYTSIYLVLNLNSKGSVTTIRTTWR